MNNKLKYLIILILVASLAFAFSNVSSKGAINPNSVNNKKLLARMAELESSIQGNIDAGKLEGLHLEYAEMINISPIKSKITGGSIPDALFQKQQSIENKIKTINDSIKLSKLYAEKSKNEYDISAIMYFRFKDNVRPYQYYLAKSFVSANESIRLKDNGLAHRYKGMIYRDLFSPIDFSIKEFKMAIKLDPKDDMAYYKLGVAYNYDEQYDLAMEAYLKGVKINKYNDLMVNNLGLLYFQKGETDKGYKIFKSMTKTCSQYCYIAYGNLANHQYVDNLLQEALSNVEKALVHAKQRKVVYREGYELKGLLLIKFERYAEAAEAFKMSLNSPDDPEHYDNEFNQNEDEYNSYYLMCMSYYDSREFQKSLSCTDDALKKYPGDDDFMGLKASLEQTIKSGWKGTR